MLSILYASSNANRCMIHHTAAGWAYPRDAGVKRTIIMSAATDGAYDAAQIGRRSGKGSVKPTWRSCHSSQTELETKKTVPQSETRPPRGGTKRSSGARLQAALVPNRRTEPPSHPGLGSRSASRAPLQVRLPTGSPRHTGSGSRGMSRSGAVTRPRFPSANSAIFGLHDLAADGANQLETFGQARHQRTQLGLSTQLSARAEEHAHGWRGHELGLNALPARRERPACEWQVGARVDAN